MGKRCGLPCTVKSTELTVPIMLLAVHLYTPSLSCSCVTSCTVSSVASGDCGSHTPNIGVTIPCPGDVGDRQSSEPTGQGHIGPGQYLHQSEAFRCGSRGVYEVGNNLVNTVRDPPA